MNDTRKVYSVYGRKGYEGPWTYVTYRFAKRDAEDARQRVRYEWSETRLLREFEYEARARETK